MGRTTAGGGRRGSGRGVRGESGGVPGAPPLFSSIQPVKSCRPPGVDGHGGESGQPEEPCERAAAEALRANAALTEDLEQKLRAAGAENKGAPEPTQAEATA